MPRPDYCPATSRTSHAALTFSLVHGVTITAANRFLKTGQIALLRDTKALVVPTQQTAKALARLKAKPVPKPLTAADVYIVQARRVPGAPDEYGLN